MAKEELLTAGKVAAKLGLSPAQVNKIITEKKIQPDQTKGACKYYGPKAVAAIKSGAK